jgi:hypothetical protein
MLAFELWESGGAIPKKVPERRIEMELLIA